jgi:hypothetical protein
MFGPLGTIGLSVTSSEGNVGNVEGHGVFPDPLVGSDIIANASLIGQSFATTLPKKLFKATAGTPFQLTFLFQAPVFAGQTTTYVNGYSSNLTINGGIGKNEQAYAYDEYVSLNKESGSGESFGTVVYKGEFTFPVGRTQGWLVFGFSLNTTINGEQRPAQHYTVVLPYVVEGPTLAQVDSLGVTTQPQIPTMIIHNPPGDNSSTIVTNTGTNCRSFEEKVSKDESNETYGSFKLGFKGSIGFLASLELEAYVQFEASGTEGSFQTKQNSTERCVTVTNTLTAISDGKGAQKNDLFVGYGIDLAYGVSRRVNIENGVVSVDTGLIYRPLEQTLRKFFLTKPGIENDILIQQAKVNDSTNYTIPQRANAQYQINVWQQVLDKNKANIASAVLQAGESINFGGGSIQEYETSIAYNTMQTIEVEHYIESQTGIEGAAYFAGSGFKAGAKFTTNQTFGEIQSSSGGQTKNILVKRHDDEATDYYTVKIVEDPVYGTPIFIVDSLNSKTSCPYEGGLQRDKPVLKINGSASPTISVSNVSLGTAGRFNVQVCNNSAEVRNYGFGFVNESTRGNLIIKSNSQAGTVNPSIGITQFATIFSIPANGGCKTSTYELSMARGDAAAPMAYQNIEFVTYAECQPEVRSSIFANIDFAGPPPPTGVAASASEICTGTPVTITANCPVTTMPRWYTVAEGGFPLAEGPSVVVNPSINTTYYVGCETVNFKRDRVATQLVLVGSPSTVLNLTADYTANSLQIANTTLTATNKIIDPARVTYKAGNSLMFNPGFEVKRGSAFTAKIGGCAD